MGEQEQIEMQDYEIVFEGEEIASIKHPFQEVRIGEKTEEIDDWLIHMRSKGYVIVGMIQSPTWFFRKIKKENIT